MNKEAAEKILAVDPDFFRRIGKKGGKKGGKAKLHKHGVEAFRAMGLKSGAVNRELIREGYNHVTHEEYVAARGNGQRQKLLRDAGKRSKRSAS